MSAAHGPATAARHSGRPRDDAGEAIRAAMLLGAVLLADLEAETAALAEDLRRSSPPCASRSPARPEICARFARPSPKTRSASPRSRSRRARNSLAEAEQALSCLAATAPPSSRVSAAGRTVARGSMFEIAPVAEAAGREASRTAERGGGRGCRDRAAAARRIGAQLRRPAHVADAKGRDSAAGCWVHRQDLRRRGRLWRRGEEVCFHRDATTPATGGFSHRWLDRLFPVPTGTTMGDILIIQRWRRLLLW